MHTIAAADPTVGWPLAAVMIAFIVCSTVGIVAVVIAVGRDRPAKRANPARRHPSAGTRDPDAVRAAAAQRLHQMRDGRPD